MDTVRPKPPPYILVVEDDAAIGDLVTTLLTDASYGVTVAATPAAAVALLARERFALVLTDGFGLAPAAPREGSIDVLRAAGATPVALFTAWDWEPAVVQAAGYVALLPKPFDLTAFDAQIARLAPVSSDQQRPL